MTKAYKNILVPIDGSEHSERACKNAISIAKACDSKVFLLHCYGNLPNIIGGDARDEIIKESEEESKKILSSAVALCEEHGINFDSVIKNGTPSHAIIQIANAKQCDLIVLGSRGLSEFSGMVLGSVSHRVLEYADIPILIIK